MTRTSRRSRRSRIAANAEQWIIDPPAALGPIDWEPVFGRRAPLELEIGCGKGLFLLGAAQSDPDTDFLGVEIAGKFAVLSASRLAKRDVPNARVMSTDARVLVGHCLAEGSVRRIHVLFPDPWWKKRHRKRRVFTPEFVTDCGRALEPGGDVHIATDVEDYFGDIQETFAAHSRLEPHPAEEPGEPTHDMDYMTNYERRFRKAGQPVYRIRYVRPG